MSNLWTRSLQLCRKSSPIIKSSIFSKTILPTYVLNGRSLWVLSAPISKKLSTHKTSSACSCHALHTEGDQIFVDVLNEEIQAEKEMQRDIPKMSDSRWKVLFNDAHGEIQGNFNGDKISVTFNLNNCVPPMMDEAPDQDNNEADVLVAYPDFNVQIKKDEQKKVVEFDCFYPDSDADEVNPNEFSIRSLTIHSGEIKDHTYMVDTENLDTRVYSYFLAYLADRGIDNQFAEELSQLATAAENNEYIKSLEYFKSFVSCK